jgi:hypothetical protein
LREFIPVEEMAETGDGTLEIPFEILGPRPEQFAFRHQFLRRWDRDQDFDNSQFRNQQIFCMNRFAIRELGFELAIGQVEMAFNCLRKTGRRALTNELEAPKQRGRHNALPDDAEAQVIRWITR